MTMAQLRRIQKVSEGSSPKPSSLLLAAEAHKYLVGGVNSPVRAFRQVGGDPIILTESSGAQVRDVQGRRYIDFIMGWGALLLGHNPPGVMRVLRQGMKRGVLMGLTHPAEIELARLITEAVTSVEQVRFTVSGTEAAMTAIRLARAYTGRPKILTIDGCYHGHSDSVLARKTAGIPELTAQDTLTVPWNDVEALESAITGHHTELAAVIIEPVAANMGVMLPESGYLARLRELTAQRNILLILDEVVTGFRVGYGGAQGLFGITPDLTVFGKIIGGGLPVGALGGSRRLMQRLAPEGDVYHGGTFAGSPLTMMAGVATLNALAEDPPYEQLEQSLRRLVDGLTEAARRAKISLQINSIGSMLTVFFSDAPVQRFAHAKASRREQFVSWAQALRRQGILIPPSPFEALFLSTAHTSAHIDRLIRVSRTAFAAMRDGASGVAS